MRGLGYVLSIDNIVQKVTPIFEKYHVKSAVLFGSYAKGTPDEGSDIDLLVDTDLRGWDLGRILADLFDIFGYGNVDLYAMYELDEQDALYSEIKKTGKVIYTVPQG